MTIAIVVTAPSRRTDSFTLSPGSIPASTPASDPRPSSGVAAASPPAIDSMTSPASRPACAAGPSGSTQSTRTSPRSSSSSSVATTQPITARRQGGSVATSSARSSTRSGLFASPPDRSTVTTTVSAAYLGAMACRASAILLTGRPSMATIRSPGSRPARAAGDPWRTDAITGGPLITSCERYAMPMIPASSESPAAKRGSTARMSSSGTAKPMPAS